MLEPPSFLRQSSRSRRLREIVSCAEAPRVLSLMRGAIAAGHPLTAEAGARVLAEGGNAVDACVAAAFASWVAESPLTGPGGGGFMLVHRARDRATRLLDFFVAVPGARARAGHGRPRWRSVDVDFDGETRSPSGSARRRAPCRAPSPGSRRPTARSARCRGRAGRAGDRARARRASS